MNEAAYHAILRRLGVEPTRAEDARVAAPSLRLDPLTVRELLGDRPDPDGLRALLAEVAEALVRLQEEIRSGQLAPSPLLVRGRPVADWLPLEEVARLLGRRTRGEVR